MKNAVSYILATTSPITWKDAKGYTINAAARLTLPSPVSPSLLWQSHSPAHVDRGDRRIGKICSGGGSGGGGTGANGASRGRRSGGPDGDGGERWGGAGGDDGGRGGGGGAQRVGRSFLQTVVVAAAI